MINFILNDKNISTEHSPGMVVLDFLRHHRRLGGTKEGCREGDCGACLILLGKLGAEFVCYHPLNSCLLPLGEVDSKHLVTIEGLNSNIVTPIQQAIVDEGAAQCGYCTPGIVVSLTAFFLNSSNLDEQEAIAAIDGNICRCTGYLSIKRAASSLCKRFDLSNNDVNRLKLLIDWQILPDYFLQIPERLQKIRNSSQSPEEANFPNTPLWGARGGGTIIAGGTDLFVQKAEELHSADLTFLSNQKELKGIRVKQNRCYIGAATTIEDIRKSLIIQGFFPKIDDYFKLISSTPIRHRATIGGNVVNASPIGDLTIFFMAIDATIALNNGRSRREIMLKDFFKGYKQFDLNKDELVEWISFPVPRKNSSFNFEKVSQRTHLDIASVNSAMQIQIEGGRVRRAHISAGGVSPVPLYLSKTVEYLTGKEINEDHIREAASIAQSEISPISDVRGSADYKRLLLRQLIFAHFLYFGYGISEITKLKS